MYDANVAESYSRSHLPVSCLRRECNPYGSRMQITQLGQSSNVDARLRAYAMPDRLEPHADHRVEAFELGVSDIQVF